MEIHKAIPLDVDESDLGDERKRELEKQLLATRTLGEKEGLHRKVLDILPTVISERVQQVLPDDFELMELELKFDIQGKLFGAGVGGEVVAKLRKKG